MVSMFLAKEESVKTLTLDYSAIFNLTYVAMIIPGQVANMS